MKRIILALCLCILMVPSFTMEVMGQPHGKLKCIITDLGEWTAAPGKKVSAPGTPSGLAEVFDDNTVRYISRSRTIPAKIGVHFGYAFTLSGLPANSSVSFRKVVTHPEIHKPDGTVSKGYTIIKGPYPTSPDGTFSNGVLGGYGFDHPYELVTGKWRFELWCGDQKIADEVFDVVRQ